MEITSLLARISAIVRLLTGRKIATPRINVEATTTCIAGVHCQLLWFAMLHDIDKNSLDALLMEFVVVAETDQVA